MQIRDIKGTDHYVFKDKKEFEQHFMSTTGAVPPLVKNWHDGEKGDWVLADDGGVAEVLIKTTYTSNTNKVTLHIVKTTVGTFLAHPVHRHKMPYFMDTDISKHPDRHRFNGKFQKDARYLKHRRMTAQLRLFAMKVAFGYDPLDAVREIFNTKNPKIKLNEILKSEKVMTQIKENIRQLAQQHGYDDKYIFDKLDVLISKSKDDRVTMETIKLFGEIIGTIDKSNAIAGFVAGQAEIPLFQRFNKKALDEVDDIEVEEADVEPEP